MPINVGPYFRISGDEIESSKGARFPISHARRLLGFVELIIGSGEDWLPETGKSIRIGHYTLDRINADGSLVAGCHNVSADEVKRLIEMVGQAMPEHPDPQIEGEIAELFHE